MSTLPKEIEAIDALASELEIQAHNGGVECSEGGPYDATPKAARRALIAAVEAALSAAEERGARRAFEESARIASPHDLTCPDWSCTMCRIARQILARSRGGGEG